MTDLWDYCQTYILIRALRSSSAYQMRHSLAQFVRWLGHPATAKDLTDETVSRWIEWLEDSYSPRTRTGHRRNLITLWRFVAQHEDLRLPRFVRRAPMPHPCPTAWTDEEVSRIRAAAAKTPGKCVNGVERAKYLTTLIDVAYQTGLRRSDLWTLRRSSIATDGTITIRQRKTSRVHTMRIDAELAARVLSLPGDMPLAWPGCEACFYEIWHRWIVRKSGVKKGALQQIRRTGATLIEKERPWDTSAYLGHRTPTMKEHYVDRGIAYGPAPRPPSHRADSA